MHLYEAFSGAADIIEKHGHTKREWGDFNNGFCIMGAIGFTISDRVGFAAHYLGRGDDKMFRYTSPQAELLFKAYNEVKRVTIIDPIDWNDLPIINKKKKVVKTLRRLANKHYISYLVEERENLKREIATLRQQITFLEKRNRWLGRKLLSHVSPAEVKDSLAEMEKQLSDVNSAYRKAKFTYI